ncbi:hypothetical protein SAMN05518672_11072 [Chitinophaga sp. CF118]|nr:hypothetical protein SAMN05518672_11072 [Chitinophaga sp. CF118]
MGRWLSKNNVTSWLKQISKEIGENGLTIHRKLELH